MKGDKGVGQYKGNGGKRGISCVQPGLLVGRAAWAWVVPAGELVVRSFCLFVFIQVTVTSIHCIQTCLNNQPVKRKKV